MSLLGFFLEYSWIYGVKNIRVLLLSYNPYHMLIFCDKIHLSSQSISIRKYRVNVVSQRYLLRYKNKIVSLLFKTSDTKYYSSAKVFFAGERERFKKKIWKSKIEKWKIKKWNSWIDFNFFFKKREKNRKNLVKKNEKKLRLKIG